MKKPSRKNKAGKDESSADKRAPLWKDALDVLLPLAVILIVLRLLLGANMPVPLVAVVSCSMLHEGDIIGSASYAMALATGPLFVEGACVYDAGSYWRDWITSRVPDADVDGFPLKSGFSVGDMILVITPDGSGTVLPFFSETRVGDVIIFKRDDNSRGSEPIIHRVVGIVNVDGGNVSSVGGTMDCFTEYEFEGRFIPYVRNCQQNLSDCPYRDYPEGETFSFYITKGDNNKVSDQCSNPSSVRNNMLPVPDSQVIARGWIRLPYLGWLKLVLNRILGLILGIFSVFL
ncbi:MAG: hypothetical protein JW724_06805 [Candidatus Altiarchaeota archaeon]|nr:hypothetical protein [Candidatus Altiarchaeota archaeon]